MFGKIVYISDNIAHVKINQETLTTNLMNLHIIFEDNENGGNRRIVGEIEDIQDDLLKVHFLGEFVGNNFLCGVIAKPSLNSKIRVITKEELMLLVGEDKESNFYLGKSPLYNFPVYIDINDFFSNHMAIFGNTGSGKSYGLARLMQNVFSNPKMVPYRANFFIFDAYGEYHNAFKGIEKINPNLNFKYYTTNKYDTEGSQVQIPLWLLTLDDMTLLLGATEHSQIPIIERMMKLVKIFSESGEMALKYKNHLIARAIMSILYSNQTPSSKRNDILSIFTTCSTPQFNSEAPVQGIGYTRKFRECFTIDKDGSFTDGILVTEYISNYIDDSLDKYESSENNYFTLDDLEKALSFTLISEGLLRNEKTYADAITIKVRLHSLAISENARFFSYDNYINLDNYISSLVSCPNNKKAQIINFNLEDIDDTIAKVMTKIYTRMLFEFTKKLKVRASIPFHILLEEAHRYVQNDNDSYLIGYNIFDRVAKEGRKYGLVFNLISQRPVEISETVISQCSNFLIFKMNHPRDLDYIKKMLPNINAEIVEKQKSLQPGTCVAFGKAFKVPMVVKMDKPNPEPQSSNCDVFERWK